MTYYLSLYVVEEFLDIFPNELPRLPPNREIEFYINLIHREQTISTSPYRMTLTELTKLRN